VLIVGLVMLAVMTLLVVSMIKTSVVELKIGGASQIAQQNLTNAERLISNFIDVNNGRFAADYLALASTSGGPVAPAAGTASWNATTGLYNVAAVNLHGGRAALQVRQIQCTELRVPGDQYGARLFVFFDVRSTATGDLGGSTSVHQGIRSVVPSGSC
jgi:hypothetical protein